MRFARKLAAYVGTVQSKKYIKLCIYPQVKKLPPNKRPKLNVMIRCRGGDDFMFSDDEFQHMLTDVEMFKEAGIDRFVFGALTDNQEIDETMCMKFLASVGPVKVTFSRAFDHTRETKKSAGIIAGLGFFRVLTSGQKQTVNIKGAVEAISYLVNRYKDENLVIMPGSGVNLENVGTFIKMGCTIVHSTCRSALQLPKIERLHQLGTTTNECVYFSDYDVVCQMKEAIATAVRELQVS